MIKIYLLSETTPANTTSERLVGTLVVPDAKKWTVTELRPTIILGGTLYVYVQNERVATFVGNVNADVQFRALNWELPSGTVLKVTSLNSTGAGILQGMEFVTNEV